MLYIYLDNQIKMNKRELVEAIAQETTDIHKDDIRWVVSRLFKILQYEFERGGNLAMKNFGSIKPKMFKGKRAYNFVTNEHYDSPDRYRMVFVPTKELKETVDKYHVNLNNKK